MSAGHGESGNKGSQEPSFPPGITRGTGTGNSQRGSQVARLTPLGLLGAGACKRNGVRGSVLAYFHPFVPTIERLPTREFCTARKANGCCGSITMDC